MLLCVNDNKSGFITGDVVVVLRGETEQCVVFVLPSNLITATATTVSPVQPPSLGWLVELEARTSLVGLPGDWRPGLAQQYSRRTDIV